MTPSSHPFRFPRLSSAWAASALCLGLMSCEGATYVNHHVKNATADTVHVGIRNNESQTGWAWDTVWTVPPGATHVHYAVDFLGKCYDCTPYEALPYGLDSLWVEGDSLTVNLMDSTLWTLEMDEGRSWIRFDQHLELVPAMFE